jgi:hypothetical protein
VAEGQGLSDKDAARQAKVQQRVPRTVDALGRQLGYFKLICEVLLGMASSVSLFLQKWLEHIQGYLVTYENYTALDSAFPTKVLYHIDRRIQQYFLDWRGSW